MSGLTRRKVTVKAKSGKTFQRSVMVRAGEKVKRFVSKHKGKLISGAALVGSAAMLHYAHKKAKADSAARAAAFKKATDDMGERLKQHIRNSAPKVDFAGAVMADVDRKLGRDLSNMRISRANQPMYRAVRGHKEHTSQQSPVMSASENHIRRMQSDQADRSASHERERSAFAQTPGWRVGHTPRLRLGSGSQW